MRFNVGDKVKWTSQANGCTRTKVGTVIEVVPAGQVPGTRGDGWGSPRDHESYVVRARVVRMDGPSRSGRAYWPRASALRPAQGGGEGRDAVSEIEEYIRIAGKESRLADALAEALRECAQQVDGEGAQCWCQLPSMIPYRGHDAGCTAARAALESYRKARGT